MKTYLLIVIQCATLITCKTSDQKKGPIVDKRFGSNIDYDDVYSEQQPQQALGNQYPINSAQQSNLQGPIRNSGGPSYSYNQPISNFNQYPQSGSNQYPIPGSTQYPNNLVNGQYPVNNYPSNTNGQYPINNYPSNTNGQYPINNYPSNTNGQYPVNNYPSNTNGQYPVNNYPSITNGQYPVNNYPSNTNGQYPINNYPSNTNGPYPAGVNAQYPQGSGPIVNSLPTVTSVNPGSISNQYPTTHPTPSSCCPNAIQYQSGQNSPISLQAQSVSNAQTPANLQGTVNSNIQGGLSQYPVNNRIQPNANANIQSPIGNNQYPNQNVYPVNNVPYPQVDNVQNPINANVPYTPSNQNLQYPINTQGTLNPTAQYPTNPPSQTNLLAQYPQSSQTILPTAPQYPITAQSSLNSNAQYSLNPQTVPNSNLQFQGNTQNIPISNVQYPPISQNVANANPQYLTAIQNAQNPNVQYPQGQITNQYPVQNVGNKVPVPLDNNQIVTQPNIQLAATDQIVFPGPVNGGNPNQNEQNFNVNNAAPTNQSPYPVATQNLNQGFPGASSSFGSSDSFNQAQNPPSFQGQVFPSNTYPNQMQTAGQGTLDQFTQYPNSQFNPSFYDSNLPQGFLFNRMKEDENEKEKNKDTTTTKPESQTEKEVKTNEVSNKKDEPKENSIPNSDEIKFPDS